MRSAINHIVDAELRARQLLMRDEATLKDRIFRAWGLANNAYKLDTEEAMRLLALIRLGEYYGYIKIDNSDEFQNLITRCQPATMQYIGGKNMSADERDVFRARYIAANLAATAKKIN